MAQRKQLAQQIQQLTEETSEAKVATENILEECDAINIKCDTIIAKIKIKRARNE